MADSKDSVLIQVKLGNDLKNQTSDSSKSDEACRDSEETTTCCQDVTDTLRFLIFDIKWFQVVYHISIIIAALYATFDFGRLLIKDIHAPIILTRLYTWTFGFWLAIFGSIGLSAGCHRLWSHHAYKATLFMRLVLAFLFTTVAESTIYYYVKHHRAHHVFMDTHADPQNVKRGFLFAQLGWRFVKPRQEYRDKVETLQFDDALSDPVVKYQKIIICISIFPTLFVVCILRRQASIIESPTIFFLPLALLLGYVIPTFIPFYFWGENLLDAFLVCGCTKSAGVIAVHGLLGSVSHMYGQRKYNKNISARDIGLMSVIAAGEGYHNFHHTFPYDYSVSEFGQTFNISKLFIDFMALFGQAYDRRRASPEYIKKVKERNIEVVHEY